MDAVTKIRIWILIFAVILLVPACSPGCVLQESGENQLTVMTWNVENLFDHIDDGTEYAEFDPTRGSWTISLYQTRLRCISRVIREFSGQSPDIVCLQEIEHRGVLEDLRDGFLGDCGYAYLAVTDSSGSAIQLGVLSRYPIRARHVHQADSGAGDGVVLARPVLEVAIDTGAEEIVVFNNHWKSRREGAGKTEPARIASAGLVRSLIDDRTCSSNAGKRLLMLCMGDLNEHADEILRNNGQYRTALTFPEMDDGSGLAITGDSDICTGSVLFCPWLDPGDGNPGFPGSYVFRSVWGTLDHILINGAGFDGEGWEYAGSRVVSDEAMLSLKGYPVSWDYRTGYGYSDHLPVIASFIREPAD